MLLELSWPCGYAIDFEWSWPACCFPPCHLAGNPTDRCGVICLSHRRKSFMSAIDLLVELASLQTAFLTLDEAIKTTNRCACVLAHFC